MALRSRWRPGREEVVATNGMVTAMEPLAAEAGLEMLKRGGNAIDAAVAVGFSNVVLEPYMATIAGMGYMLIYLADQGKTIALDFNGRAPRNANPEMYHVTGPAESGGYHIFDVVGEAHSQGPLCVTVPATCAGLCLAHQLYGTLPLEQVLEPAIQYASEGFPASWPLTLYAANDYESILLDRELAAIWLPGGHPPRSSPTPDKIVQRDLGELLRHVSVEGADALYRGEVAQAIDEFMRKSGGVLSADDLAQYRPIVGEPLSVPFQGYQVKAVATPSGGLTNLQTFRILENFDLRSLGHNSADYLHLLIQAARHAMADRYRFLGDWEHAPVPLRGLLSTEYAREIASQINLQRADVGTESDEEPWVYYLERAIHDPWKHEPPALTPALYPPAMDTNHKDTSHFNVVDKDRNAVSCTHTGVFTAGVNLPGTGVYLVGGMAWFIPKAGYANSVGGWKRPLNNMSPFMVFRDGKPVLCQGAPGARRIMNRCLQVTTNVLAFGQTPQEAIDQPVIDVSGRETLVDARMPEAVVAELERRGHRIQLVEEEPGMTGNFARPNAIWIDYETGLLRAGTDAFRPTMALGY